MANPTDSESTSIFMTSLVQVFQEHLNQNVFLQIGIIAVTYLLASLFARKVGQYLEKDIEKIKSHMRFALAPAHFAIVLKYFFWLALVWFFQALFKHLKMPLEMLHLAATFVAAVLVIRFVSFYIKSTFWSRVVYVICLFVVALRLFNLWDSTVHLLSSMTIDLGSLSFSLWNLIEAVTVFVLMWALAASANRFLAYWLAATTTLTYSDRTLIQRVSYSAMLVVVILISLSAAGIHPAAIAVTGGAIGIAIGLGLQKIGSNIVSGITLLIKKPIRQGDVIAFKKSFSGADYGWITEIGVLYVQVATPTGSLILIPNEDFVTQQIENLSYDDNRVLLHIPFGIAYKSDLNQAKTLALSAVTGIARILNNPEPVCLVREFGDSTVNLELRVWIDTPRDGIANIKDTVLMSIWDSFHANGIEIAFPQRDLHIKSAVPLTIFKDKPQPDAKDSPANEG